MTQMLRDGLVMVRLNDPQPYLFKNSLLRWNKNIGVEQTHAFESIAANVGSQFVIYRVRKPDKSQSEEVTSGCSTGATPAFIEWGLATLASDPTTTL